MRRKKLGLADIMVFWKKYFSLDKYILRERPGARQIVAFLNGYNILSQATEKNILAEFIWEFWNKQDLVRLDSDKLHQFLNKHNLT